MRRSRPASRAQCVTETVKGGDARSGCAPHALTRVDGAMRAAGSAAHAWRRNSEAFVMFRAPTQLPPPFALAGSRAGRGARAALALLAALGVGDSACGNGGEGP